MKAARDVLTGMSDEEAMSTFRVVADGEELTSMPKVGLVRAILLNH